MEKRIAALEAEVAALKEAAQLASQLESMINAQSPPNYWKNGKPITPLCKLAFIVQRASRVGPLLDQVAALREDKERLVELLDFESCAYLGVLVAWKGMEYVDRMLKDPAESARFNEARAAIDAARKEEPGAK